MALFRFHFGPADPLPGPLDRPTRGWGLPPLPSRLGGRLALGLGLLGVALLTYLGWKLFWFLTDDAYIAFRYISNSVLGYGYTWNPPPFRPVEGYTSFAWVVLLDGIWRLFQVPPPAAANTVSLGFAYGSLVVGCWWGLRMRLPAATESFRYLLVGLVLLGTVTNRTFLAWTSSGLETALFNFLVTVWLCQMICLDARRRRWILGTVSVAALVYLTRPDGLLFVGGTLLVLLYGWWRRQWPLRSLWLATPLLVIPGHLVWRKLYYTAWLPNTYHAKSGFWPESGVRYLLSFFLEYSLWFWLLLLVVWLVRRRRRTGRDETARAGGSSPADQCQTTIPVRTVVALAVLLAHFGYYTFVVGGDHFEYRVYSHLILLLFLSAAWLASRLFVEGRGALLALSLFIGLSYPLPWAHWAETHELTGRQETWVMIRPIAHRFPPPLRWYVGLFDRTQASLIERLVCARHQEHKVFHLTQIRNYPTREDGARITWHDHYPIMSIPSVGVPGWVLPNVAIIDLFGLNDYVIARNKESDRGAERREMAHNRFPPAGYVECFVPNTRWTRDQGVVVYQRSVAVTPAKIRNCEEQWWQRMDR
ncbi:MAG: hypothetical protein ABIF77_13450 [bacterium]